MTHKEYRKLSSAARKAAAREFGFRQSDYIDWKVVDGYYFCLYDCGADYTYLSVKPAYLDELWSFIDTSVDFCTMPMSLRAVGVSARAAQEIKFYQRPPEKTCIEELPQMWKDIFADVAVQISSFISNNPDVNTFVFDEDKMHYDFDRLSYMLCLTHLGRESEVLDIIENDRKSRDYCQYVDMGGKKPKDAYDLILDYYLRLNIISKKQASKLHSKIDKGNCHSSFQNYYSASKKIKSIWTRILHL